MASSRAIHVIVIFLTSYICTTAAQGQSACTNYYSNQLGMCELEARRQAVFLTSNDTVLMTSLDPNNCENYRTAVTCSATVISELGQKVYIAAGDNYKLADGRCSDCKKCDSFTVNGRCVPPYLVQGAKVPFGYMTDNILHVNFTSRRHNTESKTKAELKFIAFGCPLRTLMEGDDYQVEYINSDTDFVYLPNPTSYNVKISCEGSNRLSDTQEEEMTARCEVTKVSSGYRYKWARKDTDKLIQCQMADGVKAAIAVFIILLIIIIIILIILCCLRKLPCQREIVEEEGQEVDEEREETLQEYQVEEEKPARGKTLRREVIHNQYPYHTNGSNYNNNRTSMNR